MRPRLTVHWAGPLFSAETVAPAWISTESASHADHSLLQSGLDMVQSAHEVLDSSARTFAEQRDRVVVQDLALSPHGPDIWDADMVDDTAIGVGSSEFHIASEIAAAEIASLGWYDQLQ